MIFAAMLVSAAFVVSFADRAEYETESDFENSDSIYSLMQSLTQQLQNSGEHSIIWLAHPGSWPGSAMEAFEGVPLNATGADLFPAVDPVLPGYELVGWQLAWFTDEGTILGAEVLPTDVFSDLLAGESILVHMQAMWKAHEYTVYWDNGHADAAWPTGQATSATVTWNETVLPDQNPTRAGYALVAWELSYIDNQAVPAVTVAATTTFGTLAQDDSVTSISLTAIWLPQYTVTFDSAGGSPVASQTITSGQTATEPPVPVLLGSTFMGWTYLGAPFSFTTPITGDMTLVATWAANIYTVHWETGHADAVWPTGQAPNATVAWNDTVLPAQDPVRTGWTLTWLLTNDGAQTVTGPAVTATAVFSGLAASDAVPSITLTAQWVANTYTVNWELGATGAAWTAGFNPIKENVVWNDANLLPGVAPTYTGHLLSGWILVHDGVQTVSGPAVTATTLFSELAANDGVAGITLEAVWVAERIVSFYSDGVLHDTQRVPHGSTVNAPTTLPVKTGYQFVAWTYQGAAFDFSTPILADKTLYADWAKLYTVQWNIPGASWPAGQAASALVLWNDAVLPAQDPVRTGWTLTGWILVHDGVQTVSGPAVTATTLFSELAANDTVDSIILTAQWVANTYTVNWNTGHADAVWPTGQAANATVTWADTVLPAENPTRTGWTLTGWNVTFNGVAVVNIPMTSGQTFGQLAANDGVPLIELTAQWAEVTYTVNWNTGHADAVWPTGQSSSDTVTWVDTVLPTQNPTRTGWTLTGWNVTFDGVTAVNIPVTAGQTFGDLAANDGVTLITLTAQWVANIYTVNWNAGHADAVWPAGQSSSETVTWADTVLPAENPTRTGWTLTGWNLTFDGVTAVNIPVTAVQTFGQLAANDAVVSITLTAQWEINVYEVRFYSDSVLHATQSVEHGDLATVPTAPVKTGYAFTGWFLGTVPFVFTTPITEDKILNAGWDAIAYTVYWDSGHADAVWPAGQATSATVFWNDTVLPAENPVRAGWTIEWRLGTTVVTATDTYGSLAANDTVMSITLVAHWTLTPFTATFINGQDVTVFTGNILMPVDELELTKLGYVLLWKFDNGDTAVFPHTLTEDVIFEAWWALLVFEVTFVNDGNVVDVIDTDVITPIAAPDVVRYGYTVSWRDASGNTVTFPFTVKGDGNVTLTAHWTPVSQVTTHTISGQVFLIQGSIDAVTQVELLRQAEVTYRINGGSERSAFVTNGTFAITEVPNGATILIYAVVSPDIDDLDLFTETDRLPQPLSGPHAFTGSFVITSSMTNANIYVVCMDTDLEWLGMAEEDDDDPFPWWILVVVAVVIIAAIGAFLLLRKKS